MNGINRRKCSKRNKIRRKKVSKPKKIKNKSKFKLRDQSRETNLLAMFPELTMKEVEL